MKTCIAFLNLCLFLAPVLAWAHPEPVVVGAFKLFAIDDEALVRVTTLASTPRPDKQVFAKWLDQYFERNPIWVFEDQRAFEALLATSDLGEDLKHVLMSRFRPSIAGRDVLWAVVTMKSRLLRQAGYLSVDEDLWTKLPQKFIERVYRYRLETFNDLPDAIEFTLKPRGRRDRNARARLNASIRSVAGSRAALEILKRSTVFVKGSHHLILTAANWPHLTEKQRARFLVTATADHPLRTGIRGLIELSEGNVVTVARALAGPRDPVEFEGELRRRLRENEGQPVQVDFNTLLPPFIAERLNTYADHVGPNCFNAALNAHRDANCPIGVTTEAELESALENEYVAVAPGERRRLGDLLLFSRPDAGKVKPSVIHAATFITPDIVFTKNGMSNLSPYVLQTWDEVIAEYFANGTYHLRVFRLATCEARLTNATSRLKAAAPPTGLR